MRSVMILKGLPASSKSTYAKQLMAKEPGRWVRIGKDGIRSMLHNSVYSPENEAFVHKIQNTLILTTLRSGQDVIVDNTHLSASTLNQLYRLLENVGDVKVMEVAFNVSVDEAKRRNALRTGVERVPDEAIDRMARKAGLDRGKELKSSETYFPPKDQATAKYVGNVELDKAIIVDLDGTLAIMGNRSPYDASECDVKDTLNVPVAECVKAMVATGHKVVFMSGREDKDREPTLRFIKTHLPEIGEIELFMRATGDSRKDAIVKTELFDAHVSERYQIVFVLDDRTQVVRDCWRALGIPCFQVAEGDF